MKQLHQYVRLDTAMWHRFITEWNGLALFLDQEVIKAVDFTLYTDAAATVGYGGCLATTCTQVGPGGLFPHFCVYHCKYSS